MRALILLALASLLSTGCRGGGGGSGDGGDGGNPGDPDAGCTGLAAPAEDFAVNGVTPYAQSQCALAMGSGCTFIAAYQDGSGGAPVAPGPDTSGQGVRLRVLSTDSQPLLSDVQANSELQGDQTEPAVASNAAGAAVLWRDQSTGTGRIRGRLFSIEGAPLLNDITRDANDFPIDSETTLAPNNLDPAVAVSPAGSFLAVWQRTGVGPSNRIFARHFGTSAAPSPGNDGDGTEYPLSDVGAVGPAVAALGDGFVAAWIAASGGQTEVLVRLLDGSGIPRAAAFRADVSTSTNLSGVSVAAGRDGFLVAWEADDGDGRGIHARIFDAGGAATTGELAVNRSATSHQMAPAAAAIPGSAPSYLVTWTEASGLPPDSSGWAIRGRVLDAAGNSAGPDFGINTTVTGAQSAACVAGLGDGRWVVGWTDGSGTADSSGTGVRARILPPQGP